MGSIAIQVSRYLSRFPPENIRIYDYAEYNAQPEHVLADVFHLLAILSCCRNGLRGHWSLIPLRSRSFAGLGLPPRESRPPCTALCCGVSEEKCCA